MPQRKQQTLLSSAATLLTAAFAVKLIGAFFKIPLLRLMGDTGFGYFSGAYNIYTYIYSIAMAGLPVALSRLVSESITAGHCKNADRLFRLSKRLFFAVGAACTLLMALLAYPYSKYIAGAEMNYISILCIAPCILLCCMMAAYRGYWEGMMNMVPTAVCQVIESAVKLVAGLGCCYLTVRYATRTFAEANGAAVRIFGTEVHTQQQLMSLVYPFAAAGAVCGVTIGSAAGMVYLLLAHRHRQDPFTREELVNSPAADSDRQLLTWLLAVAVPIAIGALINNVTNFIDDATVRWRLSGVIRDHLPYFKSVYGAELLANATSDGEIHTYLYGVYNSVLTLKNLIPAFTMTLGTGAVPVMAARWSSGDRAGAVRASETVFRVSALIAFPAAAGLTALAEPVLCALYGSKSPGIAVALLCISAAGVIPFAFMSPTANMLQAIGRTDVPLKAVIFGSLIKTVLNFVLVGSCTVNIKGAAISSLVSAGFMMIYNLIFFVRETGSMPPVLSVFVKPVFCAALCGLSAWQAEALVRQLVTSNRTVSLVCAVLTGGAVYVLSLIFTKSIEKNDLYMLPKGEKIIKVLEKCSF